MDFIMGHYTYYTISSLWASNYDKGPAGQAELETLAACWKRKGFAGLIERATHVI